MRSLIVEDEFTSRMQIKYFLDEYGTCDIAVDAVQAIDAFKAAHDGGKPYDLICLDIRLPGESGQDVLNTIRSIEEMIGIDLNSPRAAKIFMTTAIKDPKKVAEAFYGLCNEYLTKPVDKAALTEKLKKHRLIK